MTDLLVSNEAAQAPSSPHLNLDPITGSPGSHPIGTGVGAVGGLSAGMAIGTVVAGPLGSAVGGLVGGVAGAIAGSNVGEVVNPTAEPVESAERAEPGIILAGNSLQPIDPVAEDLYWQRAFITEPYYDSSLGYDDYGPAYRIGIAHRLGDGKNADWDQSKAEIGSLWERRKGLSRLQPEQAHKAIAAAWHRVDRALTVEDPYFGNA